MAITFTKELTSIDKTYSSLIRVYQPDRYRDLYQLPTDTLSIQGGGLSMVAAGFACDTVSIDMKKFNRILDFDKEKKTITVEAGVRLHKINELLQRYNLYLPVQPGYPYVTVGGCIAANVHGKNQYHDGNFRHQLLEIELLQSNKEIVTLSHQHHPELFELTCGGFGLTGIIITAKLQLASLPSQHIAIEKIAVKNLATTFETMLAYKDNVDMLYSWNDLATFGAQMGRGYVIVGNYTSSTLPITSKRKKEKPSIGEKSRYPNIINSLTLPWINKAYYFLTSLHTHKILDTNEATFPWLKKSLYFKLIKPFIEPQILVPLDRLYQYLEKFEKLLCKYKQPHAIASFKIFSGQQHYLRFEGSGVSFSLQIPYTKKTVRLLAEQDQLNIEFGAITNIIKDSRLPASVAKVMFPQYDLFKEKIREFDPGGYFTNSIRQRLDL